MRARLVVLLLLCAFSGASQGLVVFDNRVGEEVEAPVYGVDPLNPALGQQGNGQVYNGAPLAGTNFTAQLFGGPTNIPSEQLPPLLPATAFRSGAAAGYVMPPNLAVSVPGVPEGQCAKVQLRSWNNRGGSITNWNQVLADPTIPRGASLPILTPPLGSVFVAPPNLVGLQSFSLFLPITLTSLRLNAEGKFQFNYSNPTGRAYCVEASTDLSQWTPAGSIGMGTGTYTDPTAVNHTRRFYRLVPCG